MNSLHNEPMEKLSAPKQQREPSSIIEVMRKHIEGKRAKAVEKIQKLNDEMNEYDRQLQEIDSIPYDPTLVIDVDTWDTVYDKYTWWTKEGSGKTKEYSVNTNDLQQAFQLVADAILENEALRYKAKQRDLGLGRVGIILASETLDMPSELIESEWKTHLARIHDEAGDRWT